MAPALRFDGSARYGAAIVAMLFATYLQTALDFSAIVQSESYAGTIRNDAPLVNIVQFALVLGSMVAALALLPTGGMRRLGAVTLVCVVLLLWATFGLERGDGSLTQPVVLWDFVLNQGFVALLAGVGGWVIARGRHPLAWIVVVVAVIPPLVGPVLVAANFSTGGYALVMQGIVGFGGLGAVWAAALIDRGLERADAPGDARV